MTAIHPIEAESYRILAQRVDLSAFGPLGAAVVARVIHASADLEYATTMVVDEAALRGRRGRAACRRAGAGRRGDGAPRHHRRGRALLPP